MPPKLDVDAVAFDVGNTLTTSPLPDVLASAAPAFSAALAAHGFEVDGARLAEAWAEADRVVNFPFATHFLQEEPIIQRALEAVGVPTPVRSLAAPELLALCRHEIRRVLAARDTADLGRSLTELRRRGKRLAVLSNDRAYATPTLLKWLGLDAHFSVVVASEETGYEKPALQVFARLVDRLELPPHRIAYVGDDTLRDVEAGRRAGLKVILWRPVGRRPEETSWTTSRTVPVEPDAVLTAWRDLPSLFA